MPSAFPAGKGRRVGRIPTAAVIIAAGTVSGCHLFDLGGSHADGARIAWHVSDVGGGRPAFDGTTVFFVARDHSVAALDPATGKTRWRSPTGTVGDPPLTTSCQIVGALVACGDSGIVALRRSDGVLAWRFDVSRDQPGRFPFVVDSETIFAGSFGRGTVYAVDGATGAVRWAAPVLAADSAGANIPSLATDGDIVVAVFVRGTRPQTGGVVALDANSGAIRWLTNFSLAASDSDAGGISVALWQASVLASSNDGRIYVLDRATGAVQSAFAGVGQEAPADGIKGPVGPDLRQIVVAGSTLYASSLSGWFIAYDLTQHRELWRVIDPDGSAYNSPIVVDIDKVYIVHFDGRLAAFSATQPKFLWDVGDYQDAFVAGPAVGPDKLFVAGITGFWAIDK